MTPALVLAGTTRASRAQWARVRRLAFGPRRAFVPFCHDCGSAPARVERTPGWCRYCAEKGGYQYAYRLELDVDRAAAVVGWGLVERLEREAGALW